MHTGGTQGSYGFGGVGTVGGFDGGSGTAVGEGTIIFTAQKQFNYVEWATRNAVAQTQDTSLSE